MVVEDREARMIAMRWAAAGILAAVVVGSGIVAWRERPEWHLARAEAALADEDIEAALRWLAVPERAAATRERALLLRARIAVERGDPRAAVRALERVDPEGPRAADYAFWRGRTLYAARQPLLAMNWFAEATKRRPDDADNYRWLAAAAYDLGNRQTAVSALETVTRLEPRDARAWRTLGLIFKESVEYERARAAFEKALAIDRSQPVLRLEFAETLLDVGDVAGVERELAACRGRVPEDRRAEALARCCRIRGDREGFRAAVAAGLAAAPGHPGLLVHRAQVALADGHSAEALEWLDRAIAADPYRSGAFYQRGVVLRLLGRDDDARRDIARSERLKQGIAEMSALNEKAERAPHDADVRCRLGRLCVDLGKPELAASWYRAALACDPKHAEARLGLGALRSRGGAVGSRP